MCLFLQPPQAVNSRGDTLGANDRAQLYGDDPNLGGVTKLVLDPTGHKGLKLTPQQRGEMLLNWLTAGGPPKPLDPSAIFKEAQGASGVESKAAAGAGVNSLFGFGKMIGEMAPLPPAAPDLQTIKPLKMIEPMNQSPMQTGVPYSTTPVPGAK